MEYFTLLNLKREPFSTSPDPDFFFASEQHMDCLLKLEMAIRLRQGLNVVMGEVGTGKTTICRQLIRRLHDDTGKLRVHLIMDPEFASAGEFLTAVAASLGIGALPTARGDRALKEAIKNHLLQLGVVEDRTIVLIIDEGQKLPGYCLENLRELLNFETNQHKLLQIVLFGQLELKAELLARPNLTDRIATLYYLEPFGLSDTRKMIFNRLEKAGMESTAISRLFGRNAIRAIHRGSRGYPRAIVNLCSKTLLALIIQNRPSINRALVKSCTDRMMLNQKRQRQSSWPYLAAALLALLLVVARPMLYHHDRPTSPMPIPAVSAKAPTDKLPSSAATELGEIMIEEGDNLRKLIDLIYGSYTPAILTRILAANPWLKDPNRIRAGAVITLPAGSPPGFINDAGRYLVQAGNHESLQTAYGCLKAWPSTAPRLTVMPVATGDHGRVFLLLLNNSFADQATAQRTLEALPASLTPEARIVDKADPEVAIRLLTGAWPPAPS